MKILELKFCRSTSTTSGTIKKGILGISGEVDSYVFKLRTTFDNILEIKTNDFILMISYCDLE